MTVNLSLFAGAGAQFFDNNGLPLIGGLLYSYYAGTSTQAATYTSNSGSIANSNPIVLDSAGRVPNEIWLTSGSTYKFILQTSAGVQIGSWDNISGANDFSSIYTVLASSVGSSLIGYNQGGTGAVTTTVQAKLSQYISVFDFMSAAEIADVTSRTASIDVTTKIQAAIDYVASQAGGVVWFPCGEYKITNTINAKTGVKLLGVYGEPAISTQTTETGTKWIWGGANNSIMLNVFDTRFFTLEGFYLDGNGATGMTGILLSTSSVSQIASSHNTYEFFYINNCLIGVQWGTLGLATPNNQTDGEIFRQFTINSSEAGSKGFVLNSGNAGQYSVIESGGIIVDDIAIDIVVANQVQINRVTSGGKTATAFCRAACAINVLIQGCESENQADLYGGSGKISVQSKFLLVIAPPSSYPVFDTTIVLSQNTINNPIEVTYPVKIVSTGDAWGYCYTGTTITNSTGTFTSGVSSCLALNNGYPANGGWQAGQYVNLQNLQPDSSYFQYDELSQPNQYAHLFMPVTALAAQDVTIGVDSRGYSGNLWERICCAASSTVGTVGDLIYRIGGASPKKILTLRSSEVVVGDTGVSTRLRIAEAETPLSTDTGTAGQIVWDSNYIYVCVGTNSWKRATLNSY